MKKKGLLEIAFEKKNDPLVEPPWTHIQNMLFMLPPGDKIPIPTTRSDYELMRKDMATRTDDRSKDVVEFIDFLFKHEKLGNVVFAEENWIH